eukprot:274056-Pyramimonas_sp.AAC.1
MAPSSSQSKSAKSSKLSKRMSSMFPPVVPHTLRSPILARQSCLAPAVWPKGERGRVQTPLSVSAAPSVGDAPKQAASSCRLLPLKPASSEFPKGEVQLEIADESWAEQVAT